MPARKFIPSLHDHGQVPNTSTAFNVRASKSVLPQADYTTRLVSGMRGWDDAVSLSGREAQRARLAAARASFRVVTL